LGPVCQSDRKLQDERYRALCLLRDLFISIANGHLAKDINALMPWAYAQRTAPHNELVRNFPMSSHDIHEQ